MGKRVECCFSYKKKNAVVDSLSRIVRIIPATKINRIYADKLFLRVQHKIQTNDIENNKWIELRDIEKAVFIGHEFSMQILSKII